MDDDRLELIALNLDAKVGPHGALQRIYREYGRAQGHLFSRATGLSWDLLPDRERLAGEGRHLGRDAFPGGLSLFGLTPAQRTAAMNEIRRTREAGGEIVTWLDPAYPANLRQSLSPPPVLYVRGRLREGDRAAVAVVGSRRASRHYLDFAGELGYYLARAGLTVVSGLAEGVDGAAHKGALAAGGRTIAVLGTGVDVPYPQAHASLAEEVVQSGALVSFFPMGTPPRKHHFPARNWVIAGLALAVVVVAGSRRSGALITARYAGAHGREVMAVPGPFDSELSAGCHALIKDGALLVTSVQDVLNVMEESLRIYGTSLSELKARPEDAGALALEERLRRLLAGGAYDVDSLAAKLDADVGAVYAELIRMEVEGIVSSLPGGRFRLA